MLDWEVLLLGWEVFGACLEGAQLRGVWCGRKVLSWEVLVLGWEVLRRYLVLG